MPHFNTGFYIVFFYKLNRTNNFDEFLSGQTTCNRQLDRLHLKFVFSSLQNIPEKNLNKNLLVKDRLVPPTWRCWPQPTPPQTSPLHSGSPFCQFTTSTCRKLTQHVLGSRRAARNDTCVPADRRRATAARPRPAHRPRREKPIPREPSRFSAFLFKLLF